MAPSPTKRKDRSEDKPKERGKDKAGMKENAEKERGREKARKRRNASSGSTPALAAALLPVRAHRVAPVHPLLPVALAPLALAHLVPQARLALPAPVAVAMRTADTPDPNPSL